MGAGIARREPFNEVQPLGNNPDDERNDEDDGVYGIGAERVDKRARAAGLSWYTRGGTVVVEPLDPHLHHAALLSEDSMLPGNPEGVTIRCGMRATVHGRGACVDSCQSSWLASATGRSDTG